jgi:predicted RNA binding protein YcfA (HicA-like mRNA interferase family)
MARRRTRRWPCPRGGRGIRVKIISGKRMCRVLEQRGWTLARINGSHHIYRHAATGRRTVVPVHANQDLKPGTQSGIMRDAGLTDDDL